jgi:hypothetical protein
VVQLSASLRRSTQALPHRMRPIGQAWGGGTQRPARQICLPGQALSSGRSMQRHCDAASQVRQSPAQAPAQQCPATQAPDWQSPSAVQVSPGLFLAIGAQRLFPQVWPSGQGDVSVAQTPSAVQERVVTALPAAAHAVAPQVVPARSRRQPPAPSQPLLQASLRQAPPGSAPPVGTGAQLPTCPSKLHAMQARSHLAEQQRPWAQIPGPAHSSSRLQTDPMGRLPHEPAVQTLPALQSRSSSQLVLHRLPLQPPNGAQVCAAGCSQRPARQTLGAAAWLVVASQVPGPQMVLSR